jgi:hypothetical protein
LALQLLDFWCQCHAFSLGLLTFFSPHLLCRLLLVPLVSFHGDHHIYSGHALPAPRFASWPLFELKW